jgi:hypothetical protein
MLSRSVTAKPNLAEKTVEPRGDAGRYGEDFIEHVADLCAQEEQQRAENGIDVHLLIDRRKGQNG